MISVIAVFILSISFIFSIVSVRLLQIRKNSLPITYACVCCEHNYRCLHKFNVKGNGVL